MLAVVKPSPLRLGGFLLTVIGGALMAFGSMGDWAAVSLGGSTENAVPTKGIDVWQGKVTLILGALIVIGILALRFVRPERRNAIGIAIVVAGLTGFGLGVWALVALKSVVQDTGVDELARVYGRQEVLKTMSKVGIATEAQIGLWMTVVGGVLATAGGFVDLAWVRQKRLVGDAIDPDTLPEASGPAA
jgi:preprotein translocase subunit SecG